MDKLEVTAEWLISISLLVGALCAIFAIFLYQNQQSWKRIEFAARSVKQFRDREESKKVISILKLEEYLNFTGQSSNEERVAFKVNDRLLRRALKRQKEMVKLARGFDDFDRFKESKAPQTICDRETIEKYQKEHQYALILRSWFDRFLDGLGYFEEAIESNLVREEEIKPYIIDLIEIISRKKTPQGGSNFYDTLFKHINDSGYSKVEQLLSRYKCPIIPPPYERKDFIQLIHPKPLLNRLSELDNEKQKELLVSSLSLSLAKASFLAYEDEEYIGDIVVKRWKQQQENEEIETLDMDDLEYLDKIIYRWNYEDNTKEQKSEKCQSFKYFYNRSTGIQAFAFQQNGVIILSFRGTDVEHEKLRNWWTNINVKTAPFNSENKHDNKIKVHRGFQNAWTSVREKVFEQIDRWKQSEKIREIWVTGHSLGGALATLAATQLKENETEKDIKYKLCTFGSPRVGNGKFVDFFNTLDIDTYRYVNNNDIVPRIPGNMRVLRNLFSAEYQHVGDKYYIKVNGEIIFSPNILQEGFDRILGLIKSISEPGIDIIEDHKMVFYIKAIREQWAKNRKEYL